MKKLGVIAGGGALPGRLLHACDRAGIETFVVGFEGQTDHALLAGREHMVTRLGAASLVFRTLRAHGVRDLVLIGSIRRPTLAEMRPDWRTFRFFSRIGLKALGDDGLLKSLRRELEKEGFTIHGVQDFAADLIAGKGPVGRFSPTKADLADIARGMEVSQALGALDVGQSVIVQEGIVLGVEGVEGTDELIRRCAAYRRQGRGGVLVKSCKPGQDRNLDLPAVGPETVMRCAETGLAGIAIHAGNSLILDADRVASLADREKIFVVGVDPDKIT